MINYTPEEDALVAQLSVPGGWDDVAAKPLKQKLKPLLLSNTAHCCCYCRRSMHQWHGLTIDIEHVLPKGAGKFPNLTFVPRNLSVSCKRCNMGIKGSDTSYYIGASDEPDPFKSELYEFIHPNLDMPDHHLEFFSQQHNTKVMIKYRVVKGSPKGEYTYNYFRLSEVEVNSFDGVQGLADILPSDSLPQEIMQTIRTIVDAMDPD